jgi:hypothetical protein
MPARGTVKAERPDTPRRVCAAEATPESNQTCPPGKDALIAGMQQISKIKRLANALSACAAVLTEIINEKLNRPNA